MKSQEIKELLIRSLSEEKSPAEATDLMKQAGVSYSFRPGFSDRVLDKIFKAGVVVNREVDFLRSMNQVFYRIALTGVAAIAILLISIYFIEGSISLNSLLGLSDSSEESIVYLLTGI